MARVTGRLYFGSINFHLAYVTHSDKNTSFSGRT